MAKRRIQERIKTGGEQAAVDQEGGLDHGVYDADGNGR
jgi:hypothetical protein